MDAAFMFFSLLWALLGDRERSSSKPAPQQPTPYPIEPGFGASTPPWPAVVPSTLPRFPGSGWEFDEPPPPAVQRRARALVDALWRSGAGAWKTEQTDGRWITYQAQVVASGKRGVVAYRIRRDAQRRPAPQAPSAQRPAPAPTPPRPAPPRPAPPAAVPAGYPRAVPPGPATAPAPPLGARLVLPTLRKGAGAPPGPRHPDVRTLQQRLGITADGWFGTGTHDAVVAYQRSHGLAPDGVVGPLTWASLFAPKSS